MKSLLSPDINDPEIVLWLDTDEGQDWSFVHHKKRVTIFGSIKLQEHGPYTNGDGWDWSPMTTGIPFTICSYAGEIKAFADDRGAF